MSDQKRIRNTKHFIQLSSFIQLLVIIYERVHLRNIMKISVPILGCRLRQEYRIFLEISSFEKKKYIKSSRIRPYLYDNIVFFVITKISNQ